MYSLTDKLSLIASEYGMLQFRGKFAQLRKLVGHWKNDIPAYISTQDVRLFIHLILPYILFPYRKRTSFMLWTWNVIIK